MAKFYSQAHIPLCHFLCVVGGGEGVVVEERDGLVLALKLKGRDVFDLEQGEDKECIYS